MRIHYGTLNLASPAFRSVSKDFDLVRQGDRQQAEQQAFSGAGGFSPRVVARGKRAVSA
jgi:hypothetical protein